jgi:DNA-binding CsgD family transcriptional regulator/tetratricopeptide (TPR) repeat protein
VGLLERHEVLERLAAELGHARHGSGRVVVLRGEAGIGKTSVARAFCDAHRDAVHVLWSGCDDLITPRPLGPVWDMTFAEPSLEDLLLDNRRERIFHALLELLSRSLRPTVMVIEDVHWADESTIDMIKYIGRRVDRTYGLLILTLRDEVEERDHPIQRALTDLPHEALEQIALQPLTAIAVSELATDEWDADELWRLSAGNPYFVAELLEMGPDSLPVSIRDAVIAKLARLGPSARELVETVSVMPGRVELALLEQIFDDPRPAIQEGERVGILVVDRATLGFRHELTRRAVEEGLPRVHRRELNVQMLHTLESRGEDVAILAHFAREAGDADAMFELLPLAAHRAVALGSHREALSHLRALKPFLDRMGTGQLADHYDLRAREEYLGGGPNVEEVAEQAMALRRRLGDPRPLGMTLLLGSEIFWWRGKRDKAEELAWEAVSVLESIGGEDLAMAYSVLSRLAMNASDHDAAIELANQALARLDTGPSRARVHALNNRGMAIAETRYPSGLDDLLESYRMAGQLELVFDHARAAFNIASAELEPVRNVREARIWFERALHDFESAEMSGLLMLPLSGLARVDELQGHWDSAERSARTVIDDPDAGIWRCGAMSVMVRLLVRRGHPDAYDLGVSAWELARTTQEPQFLGLAGSSLLEYLWLGYEVERRIIDAIVGSYQQHIALRSGPAHSEMAFWLSALGEIDAVHDTALESFVLLDRNEWKRAAAFWEERGIPYEQALCLSFGDADAQLEGLSILDGLGATPLATRIRSGLLSAGVKGVPRRPSQSTRDSPLGLTTRQTEVLGLLADGMTNAEIARRLFVSIRTIENHVSAILTRLGAADRNEAAAKARAADLIR